MFHIYIKTPLFNNSQYVSHLVEHCVWWKISENDYFKYEWIDAWCSTYYSYYILNTNSKKELNDFIDRILLPILKETIKYEHKVLKEESKNNNYSQKLTQKIWKLLYWKTFTYAKTWKMIYSTVQEYHQKYYTKNNIIILENEEKYFNEKIIENLNIYKKFDIKIGEDKDNAFVFKHWIVELFIISLLSELFDHYIKFKLRYIDKQYDTSSFETIYWDYEDYIYFAITPSTIDNIKNINSIFIDNYIKNNLKNKTYLNDKDFDGSCMVKYWYTLSNEQKKELLNNLQEYYYKFILIIKTF